MVAVRRVVVVDLHARDFGWSGRLVAGFMLANRGRGPRDMTCRIVNNRLELTVVLFGSLAT